MNSISSNERGGGGEGLCSDGLQHDANRANPDVCVIRLFAMMASSGNAECSEVRHHYSDSKDQRIPVEPGSVNV
jgi:hypothetical protein